MRRNRRRYIDYSELEDAYKYAFDYKAIAEENPPEEPKVDEVEDEKKLEKLITPKRTRKFAAKGGIPKELVTPLLLVILNINDDKELPKAINDLTKKMVKFCSIGQKVEVLKQFGIEVEADSHLEFKTAPELGYLIRKGILNTRKLSNNPSSEMNRDIEKLTRFLKKKFENDPVEIFNKINPVSYIDDKVLNSLVIPYVGQKGLSYAYLILLGAAKVSFPALFPTMMMVQVIWSVLDNVTDFLVGTDRLNRKVRMRIKKNRGLLKEELRESLEEERTNKEGLQQITAALLKSVVINDPKIILARRIERAMVTYG